MLTLFTGTRRKQRNRPIGEQCTANRQAQFFPGAAIPLPITTMNAAEQFPDL
jgi:hypothetical protein